MLNGSRWEFFSRSRGGQRQDGGKAKVRSPLVAPARPAHRDHTEPTRIAAHPCRSRARRALAGRWLWLQPGLVDHYGKPFAGQICALELRLKVQQLEAGLRAPGAALIGPPKCLRRRVWARKAPLQ